jgi:hypothetical protein
MRRLCRRSAQSFFSRPLLGRESVPSVKRHRVGLIDRPHDPPSSSPPSSHSYLPAVLVPLLASISADPDVDAFLGGVQIALYVSIATVAAFMGINFIRKKLGE